MIQNNKRSGKKDRDPNNGEKERGRYGERRRKT